MASMSELPSVHLFTDGACSGNPGPGGWGALLRCGKTERELSGFEAETTNNRMELLAVIRGVEALNRPAHLTIHTDSRYVKDGMTQWVLRWQKNGWRTASREPVKNKDLWQRLMEVLEPHHVSWKWVKGHNGHPENERADCLAREAIQGMIQKRPLRH